MSAKKIFKRDSLVINVKKPIKDVYKLSTTVLGQGAFGCVVKGRLRTNKNIERAIKIIPKNKLKDPKDFNNELDIMKTLDHPGIVRVYEWFEDAKCFFLVMELLKGGELFDHIIKNKYFGEGPAKGIFKQMVRSVAYCHYNKIVHRDIKPENYVIAGDSDEIELKLIDFGFAKSYITCDQLNTKTGTPYYIAPEVLEGNYNYKCDVWSLGVCLYILVCGCPPFSGKDDRTILLNVKKGDFNFNRKEFDHVSSECKDLISCMLTLDPEKRPTCKEVLNHPYFTLDAPELPKLTIVDKKFTFLKTYTSFSKFKKIIYSLLAVISTENELKALSKGFVSIDTNGDGVLNREEVFSSLLCQGLATSDELDNLFKMMDIDESGMVEFTEFIASMLDHRKYEADDDKILSAFQCLDSDKSGYIDRHELMDIVGDDNIEIVDTILNKVDTNKDGKISFEEFKEMMTSEIFVGNEEW